MPLPTLIGTNSPFFIKLLYRDTRDLGTQHIVLTLCIVSLKRSLVQALNTRLYHLKVMISLSSVRRHEKIPTGRHGIPHRDGGRAHKLSISISERDEAKA